MRAKQVITFAAFATAVLVLFAPVLLQSHSLTRPPRTYDMRHHVPPCLPAQAPVTTVHPDFKQAVASFSDLRRALRNAGISCLEPAVDDEVPGGRPVVHIKYLDGGDAALLAALLRAGSNPGSETALPAQPFLESMAYEQTVAARNDLHSLLSETGISGLTQVEQHSRSGL
ncbi:hypothetical protein K7472_32030 [Streptomyces sp. PTM05]|uniref:Uncharacterized protein n=1 Tax=Streptantibioticus parmotrematis TaxID=2873249 RepID=A0ABS7R1V0_9ACTN|nr:hypothetical protein [Streptantibioticus parmotrematis]MBY8889437.1 hypothetical protein [Streptantibioticus parmotrematis]